MAETLDGIERRVFGVLVEKALSQPAYYPMTVNAVVAACNQKSNRDPVMSVDEQEVWDTLEELRKRGFVSMVMPGGSSRTEKFKHEVATKLGWDHKQKAVMAELFLRGPQTPGELRSRCQRMAPIASVEDVMQVLDSLASGDTPYVRSMPRQPGQSAIRYMHLMYPDDEMPKVDAAPPPRATSGSLSTSTPPRSDLAERVRQLEQELAELREKVLAIEASLS